MTGNLHWRGRAVVSRKETTRQEGCGNREVKELLALVIIRWEAEGRAMEPKEGELPALPSIREGPEK